MELTINLIDKSYEVKIEAGILKKISAYFEKDYKIMIISDDGIPSIYLDELKKQLKHAETFIIPQGEKSKSIAVYQQIIERLISLRFSRKDYIVSLGGGVVLDLAGYVAATFKRGLRWISFPTTTLAMVDASIGGKVALNHQGIKNIIGTFYHPDIALIDPETLLTLPKRHYINGIIEALKTGMIGDEKLYRIFFEKDYKNKIEEIIYRSLKFKATIVMQDEKEKSLRKILNFGHTFGHAYEAYFAMKNYLHGEAVALGILTVSQKEIYYEELKTLLEKWHIKTEVSVDNNKLINLIYNDKKSTGNQIDLVVVHQIGKAEIISKSIEDLKVYLEKEL